MAVCHRFVWNMHGVATTRRSMISILKLSNNQWGNLMALFHEGLSNAYGLVLKEYPDSVGHFTLFQHRTWNYKGEHGEDIRCLCGFIA